MDNKYTHIAMVIDRSGSMATKFGGLPYGKNYDEEVEKWFRMEVDI